MSRVFSMVLLKPIDVFRFFLYCIAGNIVMFNLRSLILRFCYKDKRHDLMHYLYISSPHSTVPEFNKIYNFKNKYHKNVASCYKIDETTHTTSTCYQCL